MSQTCALPGAVWVRHGSDMVDVYSPLPIQVGHKRVRSIRDSIESDVDPRCVTFEQVRLG